MRIERVDAYQILDSRGNPTIEAEVRLDDGSVGRGLAPSGASTGQFEALELRDGDPARYRGKSVARAVAHVCGPIAEALRGRDAADQAAIDRVLIELDGSSDKSRLGANAVLAASMATAQAAAAARRLPLYEHLGGPAGVTLPLPEIQIIGGGAHALWRTDVQDYLVIAVGAVDVPQALQMTFDVYQAAGDLLQIAGKRYGAADEGGYWPVCTTNEEPLAVLAEAIERAGYRPGHDVAISLDIAASDLYDAATGCYRFDLEDRTFSSAEFAGLLSAWCARYPIVSVEDPLADVDWEGWREFSAEWRGRLQLVGDDLFTTNLQRIALGVEKGLANSVLIKLNQIGTVTETLAAIRATQAAGWLPVVSARSGETEDAFICHLAVASNAGQLKVGSLTRGERTVKWNELIRIARSLGDRARFAGGGQFERVFTPWWRNEPG